MVFLLFLFSISATAQHKKQKKNKATFGIKGGYNYVNVTNITAVNGNNQSGFHAGIFYSPSTRDEANFTGSGELLFSRQGYSFKTATNTGKVNLDYLLFPAFTNFEFGKFFKLQLGLQTAYLLNAKADSSKPASSSSTYNKMVEYFNRLEFSLAGGVEITPVPGFIVGARYTIGLTTVNKDHPFNTIIPSFIPQTSGINLKNNIVQVYAGFKF